jgi:hypothetical protein
MRTITNNYRDAQILNLGSGGERGPYLVTHRALRRATRCPRRVCFCSVRMDAGLISSPVGKAYFQEASKQTTNFASINQRQLKAFRVFQPPLPEQRRIVAELDALQAEVDALKRVQAETAAELDGLLPSVLDKAFKGEL